MSKSIYEESVLNNPNYNFLKENDHWVAILCY